MWILGESEREFCKFHFEIGCKYAFADGVVDFLQRPELAVVDFFGVVGKRIESSGSDKSINHLAFAIALEDV